MKFMVIALFAVLAAVCVADNATSNRQARFESRNFQNDSKEIASFLTTRNIFRTVMKLLFGSEDESKATGRQVLDVFVHALDMFRNRLSSKARSGGNRGVREAVEDMGIAGASMVKGYIKSVMATDEHCAQKYLCESSKEATREAREFGHVVAQVGGYASSFLLQKQKANAFNHIYDAARRGRSGEDCAKLYAACKN